jgi:hypothetical protein
MKRKSIRQEVTYSTKSKTCDVLMRRFKNLCNDNQMAGYDFRMSYEMFQKLNCKQIMGVVLMKDRNAGYLRNILEGE